jgi:hypothetical protein
MRDEIYVGRLISEEALAHSSGLWKKHKYIKKIGDRYYYTKEQLKKAGKKASDSVSDKIDELSDPSGDKEDKYVRPTVSADHNYIDLRNNEDRASDSWREEKNEEFRLNRKEAREAYKDYSKTAKGRLEKATKTVGNKLTYRKRLSEAAGRSFQKYMADTMNARNERVVANEYGRNAKTGMDHLSYTGHGKLTDREREVYSEEADRANARADKLEKRATANKRLQYARQSEYERTSMKARSERAKKRLEQALKRTRRKK